MVLMTTTYRHDYVPPITNRYRFIASSGAGKSSKPGCEKICSCGGKYPLDSGALLPAAAKTSLKSEWTGIAPMGLLIDPRIIPSPETITGDSMTTDKNMDKTGQCMEDQPNRFLKILRTCYPDLYERLNKMPNDELKRRLDIERLKTTYQIDYCNLPEYPDGIYKSMAGKDDGDLAKMNMREMKDGCMQYKDGGMDLKKIPDECQETYKPFKLNFADSPTPAKNLKSECTGHWDIANDFSRKPRISEYMDKVSRTGCVITRNNIHAHNKCMNGKNCIHKLKHPCKTYK